MSYEDKLIKEELKEVQEEYINNLISTHNIAEAEAKAFVTDLIDCIVFIYEKH